MTITTPADFRRIGQQEGRSIIEGHSSAHMMFDPPYGEENVAYLEGIVAALSAHLAEQRDQLTLGISREVEPKEITYMVFGTGGLSYPWWGNVQWESIVEFDDDDDETEWGEVGDYSDLDVAEPTDRLVITSWDGEREGGKKVTTLTFQQIANAAAAAWHNLADEAQRDMTEDLGLADAEAADLVLQYAVFGEPVYG
jgi:hypothetical protein